MAASVQFDLVSPERRLASFVATEVQIPALAGDMTAMAGHMPTITSLRPGVLRVVGAEGTKSYVVTGGFAEIGEAGVSVLAEQAIPLEELTSAKLDTLVADATQAAGLNADKDAADKAIADLTAMRVATGL
ncbi:F0F1 ATP synthase subunit epsilon [Tabrizicola piscis]|uniref:ATP synthase epsilon chain n=1 Tax=Tabrizicola piscis TaxID=2494374 RepID=A0A3S8U7N7_9RHOB|nr:F0F1 ATP synthase subunit epsilon [Tabrizicola piscis]AZL59722.1 F0F1 ATP synthase subunit epsilon [Tabrizicola piscis]